MVCDSLKDLLAGNLFLICMQICWGNHSVTNVFQDSAHTLLTSTFSFLWTSDYLAVVNTSNRLVPSVYMYNVTCNKMQYITSLNKPYKCNVSCSLFYYIFRKMPDIDRHIEKYSKVTVLALHYCNSMLSVHFRTAAYC